MHADSPVVESHESQLRSERYLAQQRQLPSTVDQRRALVNTDFRKMDFTAVWAKRLDIGEAWRRVQDSR